MAGMAGSRLELVATLTGLMGEVKSYDAKRREQVSKTRENLRQQGMGEADIKKNIQTEYQGVISGVYFFTKIIWWYLVSLCIISSKLSFSLFLQFLLCK